MSNAKRLVTFSYDDGISQDKRLVKIFNEYGMKCTFNLNSGNMTPVSAWEFKGSPVRRMSAEECVEVYKGHEIACHFKNHANPIELDEAALEEEIGDDIKALSSLFGCEIKGGAYPYGCYNDGTISVLKKHGIEYFRTVETTGGFAPQENPLLFKTTCHHADPKLFEYAEKFLTSESDETMLFSVWGHSYEFDGDGNWDVIERLCKLFSHSDEILPCTNYEALILHGTAK